MSPRKYDASRRRVKAETTRREILEATRALIGGKGDLGDFSMETVAEKAGVSRMTVYHRFHSRAGLLEGLADHLAQRGGLGQLRKAFLEPRPETAVRLFVESFVRFWASERVTMRRLRAMAIVFPTRGRGPRSRDEWRKEGARSLLARILPRRKEEAGGPARTDLAELLAALTSFETFDALCSSGRSPQEVARILSRAALCILAPLRRPASPVRPPSASLVRPRASATSPKILA